jgi:hypothetical protein
LKTKEHPKTHPSSIGGLYAIHLRQSSVCVKDVNATSTVGLPKHSATRSSDTGLCGGKHLILLKLASVSHRSLSEDG